MSYEDMQIATTTYDRLGKMWPAKPVTLGEFGYSYGLKLLNGEYLDLDTAAMAEMMIYLYAFANDYDGALSLMLSDWPVPLLDHSAPWISKSDQDYQAGFGIYLYDGTLTGKPKPIVHAMKFLSRYMKTKQAGTGTFKLIRTSTPIGCGYVYESNDAFFVGASTFSSSDLSLQSAQSTNCMLTWSGSKINIVTSTDADLKISKAFLKRVLKADYFKIAGNTRSVSPSGSDLSISTLEGEQLIISGINK
jgi:hypothetical protein